MTSINNLATFLVLHIISMEGKYHSFNLYPADSLKHAERDRNIGIAKKLSSNVKFLVSMMFVIIILGIEFSHFEL